MRSLHRLLGQRFLLVALSSFFILCFGVSGYMLVGHYPFLDALYMTVITLTTVGFQEVRPLDSDGRLFTIVLITLGVVFVAYHVAYVGQMILEGSFLEVYRRRRVRQKLNQMKDHYIICGYGQMGRYIVRQLLRHQVPLVVVETNESQAGELQELGVPFLIADAKEEENLLAVGIRKAKGLVAVVHSDTDNVFIVLTARDLNRDLFICARASTSGTERRLRKAGADRVVSPYASGAMRIAQNILRPTVTDFLELALSGDGMELSMEELVIPAGADLIGKDLVHSGIRSDYNLIIVAIKRREGTMIYNPSPGEVLEQGDTLVAIGPRENLDRFAEGLFGTSKRS
ncbi:voltage-gated potassium channel [Desulfacinum hydrothermale DSM 13146]|uniref:Voltage-gated potassium channel n=1 Tax=Desulfacinum hydrothermale DSM 13146 TaxID=1121390 RepID=A0A1W1XQ44_9BACT|nr:potassium channel protein [Desulfacinum hydrothermale]SMC26089.1 voltage-gated potassium channel [Desulfacinum hydrothermale DSM 13146]